jgi:hypothetical protein
MIFKTKQIERSLHQLNNNIDEEIFKLLKRNGYRPKTTIKYWISLYKRMKRNGYALVNEQDINTVVSTFEIRKSLTINTNIYLIRTKDNYVIDSTNLKLNERLI